MRDGCLVSLTSADWPMPSCSAKLTASPILLPPSEKERFPISGIVLGGLAKGVKEVERGLSFSVSCASIASSTIHN